MVRPKSTEFDMHKKAMFGAATALAVILSLPGASAQERPGNGLSSGNDRMPAQERSHRTAPRGAAARHTTGAERQDIGQSSRGMNGSEMRDQRAGANGREPGRTQAQEQGQRGPRASSAQEGSRAQRDGMQNQRPRSAEEMGRGERNTRGTGEERSRRAQGNMERERQTRGHAERTAEPSRSTSRQSERAAREPERREGRESQRASTERARHEPARQRSERVRLSERERTRISSAISRLHVRPITRVNFSVRVGVAVPASVRLRPLPADIVAIVPEYRGYDFFVLRDEIAIVEPRTHRIVELLPYSGEATAEASETVRGSERVQLSNVQRQTIRRVVTTRETTAVAPSEEVMVGETLPETVVVHEFPETVYEEVPRLRSYRYIVRDQDIYLVDPSTRRVIEEIE